MPLDPRPDDSLFRLTRLLRDQDEAAINARHQTWAVVGQQIDTFDADAIILRAKHDVLMDEAADAITKLLSFERDEVAPKATQWGK